MLLLAAAMAAFAGTPLLQIFFTPDIPVSIGGSSIGPNQVAADNLAGIVSSINFPSVIAGVHITGYYQVSADQQLLSFDSPVALPTGATPPTSRSCRATSRASTGLPTRVTSRAATTASRPGRRSTP
ncbi:MAG TPA: hypothetical protein VMD75_03860 [Candidatus Binataceae bacterium]|nr:hypothetical protein [Candidatus Binataceae bacterium]